MGVSACLVRQSPVRSAFRLSLMVRAQSSWVGSDAPREKVLILGVGWGGFRLARDLDKRRFDVSVVSPRNHFLFTPLLPSTTVGTLEFRCDQGRNDPGSDHHHHYHY